MWKQLPDETFDDWFRRMGFSDPHPLKSDDALGLQWEAESYYRTDLCGYEIQYRCIEHPRLLWVVTKPFKNGERTSDYFVDGEEVFSSMGAIKAALGQKHDLVSSSKRLMKKIYINHNFYQIKIEEINGSFKIYGKKCKETELYAKYFLKKWEGIPVKWDIPW